MHPALLIALALVAIPATAQENPLKRFPSPQSLLNGRWNGVDLERRTDCANAQNNGSRGTYAQFDVVADAGTLGITQTGITGLNCFYTGRYQAGNRLPVEGTYNCTDGKQGSFAASGIDVDAISLVVRMNAQLTAGESCRIEKILGLARLP